MTDTDPAARDDVAPDPDVVSDSGVASGSGVVPDADGVPHREGVEPRRIEFAPDAASGSAQPLGGDPPAPWTRPAWLLLTAVGCALGFLAASQAWWTVPNATVAVRVTGTTVSSGLAAVLPAAVLAAGLLGLVVRRVGRLVVGVLGVLLGAGAGVLGALRPRPDRLMIATPMPSDATFHGTAWPWLYLLAGVLMLAGALFLAIRGPRWPTRSAARFERSAADDPAAWWKELDAGNDPTASDPGASDPAASDPADPAGQARDSASEDPRTEPRPERRE